METKITIDERIATVVLKGRMDSSAAEDVKDELEDIISGDFDKIILDCAGLEYIASSGLRLFFVLAKNNKTKGTSVIIRSANDFLKSVFDATGFTAMFDFE